MIGLATSWIELHIVPLVQADLVANQVELLWLTHYPLPNKVIVDRGNEFLSEFREMIINDYSIMVTSVTSRNPQANAILERVHKIIGNILRTFKVQNMVLDDKNPWDGILAFTMLALRATVHNTTPYTPAQLIFGLDAIFQCHDKDWEMIWKRKQDLINKRNKCENSNRINHAYKQGEKVLLKNAWQTKFNHAYLGPYAITNGTVRVR